MELNLGLGVLLVDLIEIKNAKILDKNTGNTTVEVRVGYVEMPINVTSIQLQSNTLCSHEQIDNGKLIPMISFSCGTQIQGSLVTIALKDPQVTMSLTELKIYGKSRRIIRI